MTHTRRHFLQTVIAASAAPAFLRAQGLNNKLNVAIIGCGGRGGTQLDTIAGAGENIVALCDVNSRTLAAAAQRFPAAKTFTDFRKLYDAVKEMDAVAVSTAEHTHAFATLPALRMKKHVYCEKPLTHNVWECRRIREAAREAKVATQMGTQIHALPNYRRVVELVQSGAIGPIRECHVWVSRAWGLQSQEAAKRNQDIVFATGRPAEAQTPPADFNWDLFLGPALDRPFNEIYIPGPKWYRWWDFGNGTMSDLGSHWNDLPFWALKLDAPKTIEASADGSAHPELAPASMSATYEYGPRGEMPACKLVWHQGEAKPAIWTEKRIPQWGDGCLFIGDKGMILSDYSKHLLLPEDQFKDFTHPAQSIPESIGHHAEWLHACKTGAGTTCNFEYSGGLTEANHLGNVAYRTGRKIVWDATKLECPGTPEAAQYIKRQYRKGWDFGLL
ncbi:MAG: gfo/Idh/MocA family oxidoreductase [Chthoniobacteraceae bacterium]|nr:gfo/Idh/MocA family oxidoreductase [Chthoniobacteraceae bacterium]